MDVVVIKQFLIVIASLIAARIVFQNTKSLGKKTNLPPMILYIKCDHYQRLMINVIYIIISDCIR